MHAINGTAKGPVMCVAQRDGPGNEPLPEVTDSRPARYYPYLVLALVHVEADAYVSSEQIEQDTGLNAGEGDRACRVFRDAGWVQADFEGGGSFGMRAVSIDARRAVGA